MKYAAPLKVFMRASADGKVMASYWSDVDASSGAIIVDIVIGGGGNINITVSPHQVPRRELSLTKDARILKLVPPEEKKDE